MANKRIELEQYKHYVDLLEEEPNRKTWLRGVLISLITAMVLVLAMFILGMLSNSLAINPSNILEKPPAKSASTPSQDTTVPGTEQIPTNQVPTNQVPTNQVPNQSKAYDSPLAASKALGVPLGAGDGALVAQAVSTQPTQVIPTQTSQPTSAKTKKSTGPGAQTKGVGNLSNLAGGASGRGFQISLLVLSLCMVVLLYLPIRKARLEGKSK